MILRTLLALLLLSSSVQAATYYASPSLGNENNTCTQAQDPATPKLRYNSAIGCGVGGDTFVALDGLYTEFLVTSVNGTMNPSADILAVQPFTKIIPNGPSSGNKTKLFAQNPGSMDSVGKAVSGAIFSPTNKNPQTSTIFGTISTHATHIHVKNLHFPKAGAALSASEGIGVFLADSADIEFEGGSIWRGGVKSSGSSDGLHIHGMSIRYSGEGCLFPDGSQPPFPGGPCPHNMYMCGNNHIVEDNFVTHGSHSNIHMTCEFSNSNNNTIRRNITMEAPGYGIILKGSPGKVYSNIILKNGQGAYINADGVDFANNVIDGYYNNPAWVPEAYQFTYPVGADTIKVVNNQFHGAKTSFYMIRNSNFTVIDQAVVHHNMCSQSGNLGCTNVQTTANIFDNYPAAYTLKVGSPAIGAGVAVTGVTTDFNNNPFGAPPEIGAYASGSSDITPPNVNITAPLDGAMVSGASVSITATATDNVGVLGVQFKVDGTDLGGEDLVAPYAVTWDTLTASNGNHALTAVARDAAGNSTTSPTITVIVNNVLETNARFGQHFFMNFP
mgnify:CR=1 FL=1